jgi:hypothetical protein
VEEVGGSSRVAPAEYANNDVALHGDQAGNSYLAEILQDALGISGGFEDGVTEERDEMELLKIYSLVFVCQQLSSNCAYRDFNGILWHGKYQLVRFVVGCPVNQNHQNPSEA